MKTLSTLTITLSLLALVAGESFAQDRCETELVGKSYTCDISSVDSPTGVSTVTMNFENASWTGVHTAFQMGYAQGIPFACACMPSGRPGDLKTPEKSTAFTCIKAWPDDYGNNVVVTGKVAGGGKKIVSGRWLSNYPGSDSYVYSCVQD